MICRNFLSLANPSNQEAQPYLGELRAGPAQTACPPVGPPLKGPISCQVQMASVWPWCHNHPTAGVDSPIGGPPPTAHAATAAVVARVVVFCRRRCRPPRRLTVPSLMSPGPPHPPALFGVFLRPRPDRVSLLACLAPAVLLDGVAVRQPPPPPPPHARISRPLFLAL